MDPLARSGKEPPNLFNQRRPPINTSAVAGAIAARCATQRYARILQLLAERGPMALFELAEAMRVFDHQISGRLTELKRDGLVEATGQTRIKPGTGAPAQVLKLRVQPAPLHADTLAEALGYPPELIMEDETWQRFPTSDDPAPGIPYRRRTDSGGAAVIHRLEIVGCPGCGRPLKMIIQDGSTRFQCGVDHCHNAWFLTTVRRPGGQPILALVMKFL